LVDEQKKEKLASAPNLFSGFRKGFLLSRPAPEVKQNTPENGAIVTKKRKEPPTTETIDPKASRCNKCFVKVGLLAIRCRCGYLHCEQHRYAEDHECTYDYKTNGRENLRVHNPKISGEKVVRF